jgi:nonsense-mediated mRNA decay protein 3
VGIAPNARGQCLECIRVEVDLTAGISKSIALDRCSVCGAYHRNPQWINVEPDSAELLALCLKKASGLDAPTAHGCTRLRLVDAAFIWTEPHCKRLKVKATVRGEVDGGLVLEQQCVIEYVLRGGQCRACERAASQQLWRACVQLRQKAANARVLHYLEQLILAAGVAVECVEIKAVKGGIDFFYAHRTGAERLVNFVSSRAMTRVKTSKQLITHNEKAGTANLRLTWGVEVAPICKDDLVLLPRATAAGLGLPTPLCVVARVGRATLLVHPQSAHTATLSEVAYWKDPFAPLLSRKGAKQFQILDCELERERPTAAAAEGGVREGPRFARGDVQLVRGDDYEHVFSVYTHLGRVLSAGDTAIGYDVQFSSALDGLGDEWPQGVELPDVVLVGKLHTGKRRLRKRKGTHTRSRYGSTAGSECASDASSSVSLTESELGQELDEMIDELAAQEAAGEMLQPGEALAALDLRKRLVDTAEGAEEDDDDDEGDGDGDEHNAAHAGGPRDTDE